MRKISSVDVDELLEADEAVAVRVEVGNHEHGLLERTWVTEGAQNVAELFG